MRNLAHGLLLLLGFALSGPAWAAGGYAGIRLGPITKEALAASDLKEAHGAIAVQIAPGSPAENAGMQAGDILVGLDGQAIASAKDIARRIAERAPGSKLAFTVLRPNGRSVDLTTLTVTLGEIPEAPRKPKPAPPPPPAASSTPRPASPARGYLGVRFAPITPEAKARAGLEDVKGAIVAGVVPGSPAAQAGIAAGDFVVGIDNHGVNSVEDILAQAARYGPGSRLTFNVLKPSGGTVNLRNLAVTLGQAPANGGAPAPAPAAMPAQANFANEATDFGVPPKMELEQNVASATPSSIPGGQVISTMALAERLRQGTPTILIDALEDGGQGHRTLPGANRLPFAGHGGSFDDQVQQMLQTQLSGLTGNQRDAPLVFFCASAQCWESYNAALRAINLGFTNVLWYRGGLMAWGAAGLPTN